MFNKKNVSQDVFADMESYQSSKKTQTKISQTSTLPLAIEKLAKAITLLDKHNKTVEADCLETFLTKFAGDRDYSECLTKLAFSEQENAQSNAILNKALDSLDADSILDVELDDDLSDALDRMEEDE